MLLLRSCFILFLVYLNQMLLFLSQLIIEILSMCLRIRLMLRLLLLQFVCACSFYMRRLYCLVSLRLIYQNCCPAIYIIVYWLLNLHIWVYLSCRFFLFFFQLGLTFPQAIVSSLLLQRWFKNNLLKINWT